MKLQKSTIVVPLGMVETNGATYTSTPSTGNWTLNKTAGGDTSYLKVPLPIRTMDGITSQVEPIGFGINLIVGTADMTAAPVITLYKKTLAADGSACSVTELTGTTENAVATQVSSKVYKTITTPAFTGNSYNEPDVASYEYYAQVKIDTSAAATSVVKVEGAQWDVIVNR